RMARKCSPKACWPCFTGNGNPANPLPGCSADRQHYNPMNPNRRARPLPLYAMARDIIRWERPYLACHLFCISTRVFDSGSFPASHKTVTFQEKTDKLKTVIGV